MSNYRVLNIGDIFTIFGTQFILKGIEGNTIVLQQRHGNGRNFIYGLEAFRKIAQQYGYDCREAIK